MALSLFPCRQHLAPQGPLRQGMKQGASASRRSLTVSDPINQVQSLEDGDK
jgi:hypothetical protein